MLSMMTTILFLILGVNYHCSNRNTSYKAVAALATAYPALCRRAWYSEATYQDSLVKQLHARMCDCVCILVLSYDLVCEGVCVDAVACRCVLSIALYQLGPLSLKQAFCPVVHTRLQLLSATTACMHDSYDYDDLQSVQSQLHNIIVITSICTTHAGNSQ